MNSVSLTKIAPALVQAQMNMGLAKKDANNPFFKSKYTDLNSVREATIPALNAQGITVLQPTVVLDNGKSVVRTTLLHTSGEYITSDTEIVCPDSKPQTYGSALSYARRYGLGAIVCVGSEDDDGNMAQTASAKSAKPPLVKVEATSPLATTGTVTTGKFNSFRKESK